MTTAKELARASMKLRIGPGGYRCSCCKPSVGPKAKAHRCFRRAMKLQLHREMADAA